MIELRPVKGWEGQYSVSPCGKVWDHGKFYPKGEGSKIPRTIFPRWVSQHQTSGYWRVDLGAPGRRRKSKAVHRLLWEAYKGEIPDGKEIDHANRNRADNRLCNLRLATRSQNRCNSEASEGSSEFRGVSFHKAGGKWSAYIKLNNKKRHLGLFENEKDAALAYNEKAKELHGEFATLNIC